MEKNSKNKETKTKVTTPKGRPMLNWVGKKPLDYIKSFPAQLSEIYNPLGENKDIAPPLYSELENNWHNLLLHGDNKEVLGYLLNNGFRGKVDLIYIDPPFNTGVDYIRKISLRNSTNANKKIEGEDYSFSEQSQYYYNLNIDTFLQFLYERIILLNEILSKDGIFFLRLDVHYGHYGKVICDEIFGKDSFINEVIINRIRKNVTNQGKLTIPNAVDSLYVYSKNPNWGYYNIDKKLPTTKPGYWRALDSAEVRSNPARTIEGKTYYPPPGRHFTFKQLTIDEMYKDGKVRINPANGKPEYWVEEKDVVTLDTNWTDISGYTFKTGYPTENSDVLLDRVMQTSTTKDSLVLDCFIGSGTTAAVAQKLGRRWIGCDINKGAIQTTSKRLQDIIANQIDEAKPKQEKMFTEEGKTKCYKFATYKVNDYDLQILHTEALELTTEHLGITRTKTDNFFDGTRGKNLVKIIDFNHPLSLLDLQLLKDELKKRPEEDRDITVVCLGKELSVTKWIDEHNKTHPVNKIGVIELRTDSKYGRFLLHKPCTADVNIKRDGNDAEITIKNFISPTIIERLDIEESLFKVKIPDFRSMIDVVLIDNDYDSKVFNIVLSDVPEKKNDLVEGKYNIEIPKDKTTIAIKIVDMLGEELLITSEI